MKRFIYITILSIFSINAFSQDGVGIGTGVSLPDVSAMLEVKSTERGLLIPKVALANRPLANAVPAGLMIYNTTDKVFNYSNGITWIVFPVAYIKEIADIDNDTKVTTEKNADEDILRFSTGQSGSEVEVSKINKTGIDVNRNSGSSYLINNSRALGQNKSNGTLASGNNSYLLLSTATGTNTASGGNSLQSATGTASQNTAIGVNTGSLLTGNGNTLAGFNAGKALTTGKENTIAGYQSLLASTTGKANLVTGASSATNATGDSAIIMGANSATTLTSGNDVTIIGASKEPSSPVVNDFLSIGGVLTANTSTKVVSMNGLYSFPGTTGGSGDILRLNASAQLEWTSRVPKQVAGAMADLKPFDPVIGSTTTTISGVYYMKVMSYSTAVISYMSTFIYNGDGNVPIEMGIYDNAGVLLGYNKMGVFTNTSGELQVTLNTSVNVSAGSIYYIAIYTSDATAQFLYLNDSYNKPRIEAVTTLPNNMTGVVGADVKNIWVNAF